MPVVRLKCSIIDKGNTNSTKSAELMPWQAHDFKRNKIGHKKSTGENTRQEAEGKYRDFLGT